MLVAVVYGLRCFGVIMMILFNVTRSTKTTRPDAMNSSSLVKGWLCMLVVHRIARGICFSFFDWKQNNICVFEKIKDTHWKMEPIRPNFSPWAPIWALFIHFAFFPFLGLMVGLAGQLSWLGSCPESLDVWHMNCVILHILRIIYYISSYSHKHHDTDSCLLVRKVKTTA